MNSGDEIMATENSLIDAVVRFTNSDVDEFRRQWNAQIDTTAETAQKQAVFEAEQKKVQGKNLLAGGISCRVKIKYTSLSGELKDREVVIRRVFKSGSEILIDALCLDINAPRLIKMDNIVQLTDIQNKTLYTKPELFFDEVLGIEVNQKQEKAQNNNSAPQYQFNSSLKNGELKTAIDMTRHEITALLFVSGIDGAKDISELKKVIEYVHRRCPNLNFDDAQLMHYLQINYPDTQSFYFALERILGKEGWIVKMFLEKLLELVVADGKKDDREKLFLADFFKILEEEGFELNFKTN